MGLISSDRERPDGQQFQGNTMHGMWSQTTQEPRKMDENQKHQRLGLLRSMLRGTQAAFGTRTWSHPHIHNASAYRSDCAERGSTVSQNDSTEKRTPLELLKLLSGWLEDDLRVHYAEPAIAEIEALNAHNETLLTTFVVFIVCSVGCSEKQALHEIGVLYAMATAEREKSK
jgi:hypothetical protein